MWGTSFLSSPPMITFNSIILFSINSHLSSTSAKVVLVIIKIILIFSCQLEIISLLSKRKDEIKFIAHNQLSTAKNIFICLFVALVSNGIALFMRNILTIVGIAGGVCTCVISFLLPCYSYNKLLIGDTVKQILNFAIMFVAFPLGLIITGYALYDCANVEINI